MTHRQRFAAVLGALVVAMVAGFAAPVLAARQPLAMLDEVESGRWELRMRDPAGAVERICMRDARRLIQMRHPFDNCERLIVNDTPTDVTVQYTCRGRGYGRTHIRRESNRLLQVDSQGIAEGLPFAFVAEARRIGDCPG
jgi:hypothetical protein